MRGDLSPSTDDRFYKGYDPASKQNNSPIRSDYCISKTHNDL